MIDEVFLIRYQELKETIEKKLPEFLPAEGSEPAPIGDAMRYAVLNGGKRLRPVLVLEAAHLGSGAGEAAIAAACAVEMVHCYSLVHDDLPAMDNDDMRRGKPTCHRVYGEDMAILAGDALLTQAFFIMASLPASAAEAMAASRELAEAIGWRGMVGGQVIDLKAKGQRIDHRVLHDMHRLKTGALITAALRIGGIVSGMGKEELQALTAYGEGLGLAFQITDDILDVVGQEETMGKPVGSDEKNDKPTFVSLYGLSEARRMAQAEAQKAAAALDIFGVRADFLRWLVMSQLDRDR